MTHLYKCLICGRSGIASLESAHYFSLYRCGVDLYECQDFKKCGKKYFVECFGDSPDGYNQRNGPKETKLYFSELANRAWFVAQHGKKPEEHLDAPLEEELRRNALIESWRKRVKK